MKRLLALATVSMLLIAACGKDSKPSPPTPVTGTVTLVLFGAPWCKECREELPAIDKFYRSFDKKSRVSNVLYVTSGDNSLQKPDQSIADKYKDSLGLSFTAQPDPWKWTNYRKYFPEGYRLPTAVLLSADGTVLRAFAPGTYTAADVAAEITNRVK
jgi:thiol-disulfide isomerase/thioredoxin